MPRLPTEADLGGASAPRVPTGVPSHNVSGDDAVVAKATARFGATVANVGEAIDQIDKQLTKSRQASQLSDAVGRATGELGELEVSFQSDQDFKTSPTRYTQQAEIVRQKYEKLIDDPTVREAFQIRFRDVATTKRLNVIQSAAKQEGDYNVAMLDRNAAIYATSAANAANSAERDVVIDQFRIDLSNMRMRNWITDVEAGNRERAFLGKIDQAIVARDMAIDPYSTALRLSTGSADGLRADGTAKGDGFLGRLKRPDGKVSTEISIGVNIDGKETQIPTLVPTLSQEEVATLLTIKEGESIPEAIIEKAVAHARQRMSEGKSVFAEKQAYAPNLDPLMRERLIDQGFRRAEVERTQRDAAAERERKRIGDEFMKAAVTHQSAGTLTPEFVERIKPFIDWREYQGLKEGMKGGAKTDDPAVFANIEGLVDTNPEEARRQAFIQHKQGRITNQTLHSVNSRTRSIDRQEGPKSPYERERAHITQVLKPSEFVTDPAPGARYAVAIREFEDYAGAGKRTPEELRAKADDVVKRYSMVDMADLARKTGLGARAAPAEQISANLAEAERLMADRKSNKISEADFRKKMRALDRSTAAAERAMANGGK